MQTLPVSVIISTYNSVVWLNKVLEGYKYQTHAHFEVWVADDGSTNETKTLIETHKKTYPVPLHHIWHEDQGYRRQRILNQAIQKVNHEYIIFTDGDCIPRQDFVETHVKHAESGYFLSGGYCKLSMSLSKIIDLTHIAKGLCFKVDWLKSQDQLGSKQALKISAGPNLAKFLDFITPTGATFNNCNSSAWKADLIAINGYDERMQYGGPDRELGERLVNNGIKSKQLRHQAICLHLDHPRGYKTKASLEKNLKIRERVKKEGITWTDHGIKK